jgi:hypothetical protein
MKKKFLSIHRPIKKKFVNEMFGHYIAGLIDGDGHISIIGHIVICFNKNDYRSAIQIKSQLKYGKIRRVNNKNAYNLIISNKKGIIHIASLIKDKLKHPNRIDQYNSRLVKIFNIDKTSYDTTINFNTSWFSGFFDADGHLRIYIIERKKRLKPEIRLLGQIDQKTSILLTQIKNQFGGFIGYRKKQDTFYYSTVSYNNMFKLLSYFDKFSLQYYRTYLRSIVLRKTYILVQNNYHLKSSGITKLKKYQKRLKTMI